jgi:hypothetical protein
LLPLDFGPRIFQRDGTIEYGFSGRRVGIDTEISQALELVAAARRGAGQGRFELGIPQYFERMRIQIRGEILAGFSLIGIFLKRFS